MNKVIIVRYCEIHLKGKNRSYFERLLIENIERNLKDIPHTFSKLNARYLIGDYDQADAERIFDKLNKICGIHSYSESFVVDTSLENISQAVLSLAKDVSGTFKIDTNRADKTFCLNSVEVSREMGGVVLDNYPNLKVDVVSPENVIYVDIREGGKTLVFSKIFHGLGGLPTSSSGRGMLMLSGGIDSPVAGYMMAKRGMKLDAVHFHSYPYTSVAAREKVEELAGRVAEYCNGIDLYIVRFTEIQEAIHENCPEELMITLMRRFMMRIAERLALKHGGQAIITGESLGQVASQTIESITSSNSVVKMPVLRPLIAFDKLDIIEIANKIDTFNTSILPYEDCCTVFLPKFPAIKPRLETVLKAEARLNVEELIENALNTVEVVRF
ncbi:MAG: tRNA 4-thiouridine(8) synthase ThiI [Clostridia bacterium]|nr:tRNA 4-thiouridine(8) synthase ThiI [Clostridia bacterium]